VRQTHTLLAAALICACLPATAHATRSVRLQATLTPEQLGQSTTVGFGFQIATHGLPVPLTGVDIRYPGDLGIALSGLGLATCTAATLQALGPPGCPADSRMGYGSALAEIPIGPEIVAETAHVTIIRAPIQEGHLALLFYANAATPVNAWLVFPGQLLPAPTPFGGRINIAVPLIPSLPEAPDVAVVRLRATLGPEHLTYYEHTHGRTVAYHPKGVLLPDHCPRGGFPFHANLAFADGSDASASTAVPCPR